MLLIARYLLTSKYAIKNQYIINDEVKCLSVTSNSTTFSLPINDYYYIPINFTVFYYSY